MHSSRMRTARLLTLSREGGVCLDAEPPPLAMRQTPPIEGRRPYQEHARKRQTPSPLCTEWLTHACENITYPQLRLRAVMKLAMLAFLCRGEFMKISNINGYKLLQCLEWSRQRYSVIICHYHYFFCNIYHYHYLIDFVFHEKVTDL